MLVEELIEQLKKMDPNAEVLIHDPIEDVYVPVDGAKQDETGDVIIF